MNPTTLLHSDRRTNIGSDHITNSDLQLLTQLKAFLERPINEQTLFARMHSRVRRMALQQNPHFEAELIPEVTHEVIRRLANCDSDEVCTPLIELITLGNESQELLDRLDELIERQLASVEASSPALKSSLVDSFSAGRRSGPAHRSYERCVHRHQPSEPEGSFLN